MSGKFHSFSIDSTLLKANFLFDPTKREQLIYLPEGYGKSKQKYPVIFFLPGFYSLPWSVLNREAFSENLEERINRLIREKILKPAIIVVPDCFTAYGGSQYLDSSATGHYQSYLYEEVIPFIKQQFSVELNRKKWAIMGKSSGGYGAIRFAMRYPDCFSIVAMQSADLGFEYLYLPDFPTAMMALEQAQGVSSFLKQFKISPKRSYSDFLTLNVIAMAAAYSPNPNSPHGFDLPFSLKTAALIPDTWARWLSHDPIHLIEPYHEALAQLSLFIDCGTQDEYRLYAGARIFSQKLADFNIQHRYHEFNDTHRQINYRLDEAFKFISEQF